MMKPKTLFKITAQLMARGSVSEASLISSAIGPHLVSNPSRNPAAHSSLTHMHATIKPQHGDNRGG